jgi:hypothetical protein
VDTRYSSARFLERDLKDLLVRHGNEPTEHDVAEYVNTLLKGTRAEVEALLEAKFVPSHLSLTPKPEKSQASGEPRLQPSRPSPVMQELPPPPVQEPIQGSSRPWWILPAMLAVAALATFVIWLVRR